VTIKEYAEKHSITRQAVLYRIRKKKVKASKNHLSEWNIEEDTKNEDNENKKSIDLLEQEIYFLKEQLKSKDEIIEAEKKVNMVLLHSVKAQNNILEHKTKESFFARIFKKEK
jgi:hypothetical protein